MRIWLLANIVLVLAFSGCAGNKAPRTSPASLTGTAAKTQKPIVTPENVVVGKVTLVNAEARYVVLTFAGSRLPAPDQRLNVYRQGLKVGEVKISGSPGDRLDENMVAYVLAGEVKKGDDVKDN